MHKDYPTKSHLSNKILCRILSKYVYAFVDDALPSSLAHEQHENNENFINEINFLCSLQYYYGGYSNEWNAEKFINGNAMGFFSQLARFQLINVELSRNFLK